MGLEDVTRIRYRSSGDTRTTSLPKLDPSRAFLWSTLDPPKRRYASIGDEDVLIVARYLNLATGETDTTVLTGKAYRDLKDNQIDLWIAIKTFETSPSIQNLRSIAKLHRQALEDFV